MSDPSVLQEAKDFLKYLETLQSLQNLTYENEKDPFLDYLFSKQEEESRIDNVPCCGNSLIEDDNFLICEKCGKTHEITDSHLINLQDIPPLSTIMNRDHYSSTRVLNHIKNLVGEPTHYESHIAEEFCNYWRSGMVFTHRIYMNNRQIAYNILNHTRKKKYKILKRHRDIEKAFTIWYDKKQK